MRDITVRQIEREGGSKHVALHRFPIPDFLDKGFYPTITSFNAFFNSGKMRNWSKDHLFHNHNFDDGHIPTPYEVDRDAKLPVIYHDGLYDFFEAIGYDRTKQKFSTKKHKEPKLEDGPWTK